MAALRAVDGIKWGMEKKAKVRDQRTKKLVWCAMLAALTCVSTAWISFPIGMIPGAYIHAGDAVIYLAAYLLGPLPGAIVGAIGSAGADLMLGAYLYVIPTFVIKGILGAIAGVLLCGRRNTPAWIRAAWMLVCGLVVLIGYGVYEAFLYGIATALASAPFNGIQMIASAVIAAALSVVLDRVAEQERDVHKLR